MTWHVGPIHPDTYRFICKFACHHLLACSCVCFRVRVRVHVRMCGMHNTCAHVRLVHRYVCLCMRGALRYMYVCTCACGTCVCTCVHVPVGSDETWVGGLTHVHVHCSSSSPPPPCTASVCLLSLHRGLAPITMLSYTSSLSREGPPLKLLIVIRTAFGTRMAHTVFLLSVMLVSRQRTVHMIQAQRPISAAPTHCCWCCWSPRQ